MKKNTNVSWLVAGAAMRGHGKTITDEEAGKILVAVESMAGEPNPGYHAVICCTVTWLTPTDTAVQE